MLQAPAHDDVQRVLAILLGDLLDDRVLAGGVRAPDHGLGAGPGRAQRAVRTDVDALAVAVLDEVIVAPQRVHFHLQQMPEAFTIMQFFSAQAHGSADCPLFSQQPVSAGQQRTLRHALTAKFLLWKYTWLTAGRMRQKDSTSCVFFMEKLLMPMCLTKPCKHARF